MPDVFTHFLVGASIALLVFRADNRPKQMLIILGALLIDIERPLSWLLSITEFWWIDLSSAFHSILGAIVLSYFAAACFVSEDISFRTRFTLILIGCSSHLLLDMTMYPWSEMGLFLLYPLKIPFSFNLLWSDYWLYPVFGGICLLAVLSIRLLMIFIKSNTENGD